jgi:hypothetical protein
MISFSLNVSFRPSRQATGGFFRENRPDRLIAAYPGVPRKLPFRFLIFLSGRSFIFNNLTALFCNLAVVYSIVLVILSCDSRAPESIEWRERKSRRRRDLI